MLEIKNPMGVLVKKKIKNYGEKFQNFLVSLDKVFTHFRTIDFKPKMPEYMMMERVLMLAILQKKSLDYLTADKQQAIKDLRTGVQKSRNQIAEAMKIPETDVQKNQQKLDQYLIQLNFINNSNSLMDEYIFYLILSACNKKAETSLFGKLKKNTYSPTDIQSLSEEFKVKINYMEYEKNDKILAKQFENPNDSELYILLAKEQYYLLYCKDRKNLSLIQAVENGPVDMQQVERIFSTRSLIEDPQKKTTQTIPEEEGSTYLFPSLIGCAKCGNKCPEFDCLFWNYEYLCGECVVEIGVDTSHIPAPRILKYCQERQLNYTKYKKACPECTGITMIKNYNPAKKPKRFTCDVCTKSICLEHSCNIYECFCFCLKCSAPTLFIPSMNLNFCQSCRVRHCFNCNKKDKKFCSCICERCLNKNSENHECEPSCHFCLNSPSKMKNCQCGLMICYGCYYMFLGENGKYQCHISDYS